MRAFVGTIRSQEPDAFTDDVAATIRARFPHVTVETRVKSLGGRRLSRPNGEDIGDIDVLVVCPSAKRILAIEVKDFSLARNPQEVASECERLFVGEKCAVAHHAERFEWIKENLEHVLTTLNARGPRGHWRIVPLIVTSQDLMSPLFRASPMPVLSFKHLEEDLKRLLKSK
jgi:hypothetical protein